LAINLEKLLFILIYFESSHFWKFNRA